LGTRITPILANAPLVDLVYDVLAVVFGALKIVYGLVKDITGLLEILPILV